MFCASDWDERWVLTSFFLTADNCYNFFYNCFTWRQFMWKCIVSAFLIQKSLLFTHLANLNQWVKTLKTVVCFLLADNWLNRRICSYKVYICVALIVERFLDTNMLWITNQHQFSARCCCALLVCAPLLIIQCWTMRFTAYLHTAKVTKET